MRNLFFAATAAIVLGGTANAAVLFSDDFNGYAAPGVSITNFNGFGDQWTVTGQVDLVGNPNPYSIEVCDGHCIDLDGSPGPGTITTREISFIGGTPVTVSFDVSGNQRGAAADSFFAGAIFTPLNSGTAIGISGPSGFVSGGYFDLLNNVPYTETIRATRPFLTYSFTFVADQSGTVQLTFGTTSFDRRGPILDNVSVLGVVPEPATWAMMIAGFGMVGVAMRRRGRIARVSA